MRTELSDGRLTIRRLHTADVPRIFAAARASVNEVYTWLPWCHPDYKIEETADFVARSIAEWDKGEVFNFGMFDTRTGDYLGGSAINHIVQEYKYANLGYWVRTSQAGRGVATAATLLTARFGLEDLGLQRIEIVAAVGNLASQRVAEKAGALKEGVMRKRLLLRGRAHDAVLYSLVAEDFA